jgi:hypothetical protein
MEKEIVKKILEIWEIGGLVYFKGIPITEFNREELLKICTIFAHLIFSKDECIEILSKL